MENVATVSPLFIGVFMVSSDGSTINSYMATDILILDASPAAS